MVNQVRLRLTGNGGSGICELMEQPGQLRYRISLEGEPGDALEVWLQGRSPYMENIQRLARTEAFAGKWQYEGEMSCPEIPWGWLWVLRSEKPWLVGVFPGVVTPTEAARRVLLTPESDGVEMPALVIPIPGLNIRKSGHHLQGKTADGRSCRIQVGSAGRDPFDGRGCYWAGEAEKGLWIWWEDQ